MNRGPLILISSCARDRANGNNDVIRDTWLKAWGSQCNYRFVLGHGNDNLLLDEIAFDVPDDYDSLSHKTKAGHRWAHAHNFGPVFQCFTDTYVCIPRLLRNVPRDYDYVGYSIFTHPCAHGGAGYWCSERATAIIGGTEVYPLKHSDDGNCWSEDQWVGDVLRKAGISLHHDSRYWTGRMGAATPIYSDRDVISVHLSLGIGKYESRWMREVHNPIVFDITMTDDCARMARHAAI